MFKYLPVFLAITACSTNPVRHIAVSPEVNVSETGIVKVTGDSQVAPQVDTKKTGSRMIVPEGSRFVFNEKLGEMTMVLSKASEIAVNRTETAVKGPVAFTPDKGPTVGEEMEAKSSFWTVMVLRSALLIGGCAAVFGLVKDWPIVMWGGVSMATASLFGLFVNRHPVLMMIIGGAAAAIAVATFVWHTRLKKLEPQPAKPATP